MQHNNNTNTTNKGLEGVLKNKINSKKEYTLNLRLSEADQEMLNKIQKKLNIKNTSNLIRMMIKGFYEVEFKKKAH